ncbi:MAG: Uma2 family endonuclease [Phormidesmis sp.]
MTQAKVKFPTFAAYLSWSEDAGNFVDGRFELIEGELFEVPPEKELNNWIARCLMLRLIMNGRVSPRLIVIHSLELQVPVLRRGDSANRFPDLVVLQPKHLSLMQKRLTITIEMPPPKMVCEVVSTGRSNRERDFIAKRAQYAARGIPEYWLISPEEKTITVLKLQDELYVELGTFQNNDLLSSSAFPNLQMTAAQVFKEDQSDLI